MATAPSYAATINVGSGLVPATADTSLTAPTNTTTILTAGNNGSNIFEIDMVGTSTTSAGVVNIFRYDQNASTYHLIDQVLVPVVTSSTTSVAFRAVRQYTNFFLLGRGGTNPDQIRVTTTVAGNQSIIKVTAFGGDY